MKVSKKYYRVNPSDIGFIRYIFEAHDGLAVISTLPEAKDTIVLRIAPGCEEDVLQIVSGLKLEVSMDEQDMKIDNVVMDDKKYIKIRYEY
ncbi:MAG: DUF4911 domain-containing protein [Desulfobacteraceae bacterium]